MRVLEAIDRGKIVIYRLMQVVAAVALMLGALGASCLSPNVYAPLTNPVSISVINETPYRAIFTYGAFNQLDQNATPQFDTVEVESQANDSTTLGTTYLGTSCLRAITVGSAQMIQRIKDAGITVTSQTNPATNQQDIPILQSALVPGVKFSDAAKGSADETNPTRGTASELTVLQGVDYPCGSVVILRLKQDSSNPDTFSVVFDGAIF